MTWRAKALEVAAALRHAGMEEEAFALLAAAAPASVEAALALHDVRPLWPGLDEQLREYASSAPWVQRRRVSQVAEATQVGPSLSSLFQISRRGDDRRWMSVCETHRRAKDATPNFCPITAQRTGTLGNLRG